MTPKTLVHAAVLMAVITAVGGAPMDRAPAGERHIPGVQPVGNEATVEPVTLGRGTSLEYDFQRDIKDVLVADPKIANAVIRSSRRAYIIGNANGSTNISFFDAEGRRMARFNIVVAPDVNVITAAIRKLMPGVDVSVTPIGDGIMLAGTVSSQAEAHRACEIASHFVSSGDTFSGGGGVVGAVVGNGGNNGQSQYSSTTNSSPNGSSTTQSTSGAGSDSCKLDKIVNAIAVSGQDQIMLRVTVAEIDRQIIKQLGINLSGSVNYGTAVVNFNNTSQFPINGIPGTSVPISGTGIPSSVSGVFQNGLTANLQAMEQAGVVRTLAEPSLTAISGETAHFLVGGMFPYPIAAALGQPPSIQFQNFGVGLNFTPVVLSEGRISLHVATEVSELNPQNSVTVAGITVPGLTVRRADTTAEISSGGTLVMAGMIEDQTKQTITGLPEMMEVPVLGALFKSRDYLNNKTELVVLVTPYTARAVTQKNLSRPDDGFADASDPASVLLGRLNRIYGVHAGPPNTSYYGHIGFILD